MWLPWARFCHGVAFLGTRHQALEGIEVSLIAVGLDAAERVVFILGDDYQAHFDESEAALGEVLHRLGASGAIVLGVSEALAAREPLEVVWTAPAEQPNPGEPQALETLRPIA